MSRRWEWAGVVWLLAVSVGRAAPPAEGRPLEFHVVFDRAVSTEPFTGRVYVLLSKNEHKEPPSGPNWFHPEPFFAVDVKGWKPGEVLVVGAGALGCPAPLPQLEPGAYHAQAVMDFDPGDRSCAAAEGNGYSKPVHADLDPKTSGAVALTIDQVYHARPFVETERVKVVDIESKLLTAFNGRPTRMRAGVVLPPSFFTNPDRRYPVVYEIPGFGGTHFGAFGAAARNAREPGRRGGVIGGAGPELPARPSRLRGLGQQRPVRPGAGRGADPGDRGGVPRPGDGGRPIRHRPLVRRLEQPVAAGGLPGHLRRRLVACRPTQWISAIFSASI